MKTRFIFTSIALLASGTYANATTQAQALPSKSPLFQARTVIEVVLEAPFSRLFKSYAEAMKKEGAVQDDVEKATALEGKLSSGGARLALDLRVRGNTSTNSDECSFPKLKIKFKDKSALAGTIFAGSRAVKLATHCGEMPDGNLTPLQRAANEEATAREGFLYDVLDLLDLPSLKARAARVTYVDTETGTKITRKAFFLEDSDHAAERYGGVDLDTDAWTAGFGDERIDASAHINERDLVGYYLAQVISGNTDFALRNRFDVYPWRDSVVWNTRIFQRPDRSEIAIAYDFDIAPLVNGSEPQTEEGDKSYLAGVRVGNSPLDPVGERVFQRFQQLRAFFGRGELDRARQELAKQEKPVRAELEQADLSPKSRRWIARWLDAVFTLAADDAAFYVPAITESRKVQVFEDAAMKKPNECSEQGSFLAAGTLVQPLAKRGRAREIQVLDTLEWLVGCPHRFWVEEQSLSSHLAADYPAKQ